PMESLRDGLARAIGGLSPAAAGFAESSHAILTTDTRPKAFAVRRTIGGRPIVLLGLAKGAAMIGPRMATMLAFLLTDAPVAPGALQGILGAAVEETFNCISVDGHTSTNDTVLPQANVGAGGGRLAGPDL